MRDWDEEGEEGFNGAQLGAYKSIRAGLRVNISAGKREMVERKFGGYGETKINVEGYKEEGEEKKKYKK